MQKLSEQPLVRHAVARFDQLPKRDQRALQVLGLALAVFLVYFLVWRPAAAYHEQAISSREAATELLRWMRENRGEIQALAASGGGDAASSGISGTRDLMSTVTRSAEQTGLALQRFEPSGEGQMRVWLEDADFNQVARWLETLSAEYGIVIDQAAVDRNDQPGLVSVRLTLTTG
ncbi:general secretion pathway protein M [Tamilnaduibacter salinus]|uniref:Type II secretion system protein M n=2 Tax=Tamilnaduibacter salinus TaxID=1484056 RepID=A0A2A2I3K1_9GAMM|nr:type II secretion system protein M [Tamilnaduibacter salinus]PAV25623.1 general secretion pathway protein GspM [Tamilnaduibacter salinus]PVY78110.1 general secretion pathway protein M [Tamilnaduibacter salinus]